MRSLNIISIILLVSLNCMTLAQTITTEEFNKLPTRTDISNVIPRDNYVTIKSDSIVTGRILSTCDGAWKHYFGPQIGVIKLQSSDDNKIVYSILTPD